MPVLDAVGVREPVCLLVVELVEELHALHDVPRYVANQLQSRIALRDMQVNAIKYSRQLKVIIVGIHNCNYSNITRNTQLLLLRTAGCDYYYRYLVDVVGVHRPGLCGREPEAHVLVAHGELRVGQELRDLAIHELGGEPRVLAPEQADVRDVEEHHGQALQAESEGPALLGALLRIRHYLLVTAVEAAAIIGEALYYSTYACIYTHI